MASLGVELSVCAEPCPLELAPCRGTSHVQCAKVKGHEGPHKLEHSWCNRPVGHEGEHMVLDHNFCRLAVWSVPARASSKRGGR